jgi:hypothetical protein
MKRALIIILFAMSLSAFSQSLAVSDSYAIYSLAVKNAATPSGNTQFLISAKMMPAPAESPNNTCHPIYIGTDPWEKSWNEVLSDWKARTGVASINLDRSFNWKSHISC